jgi:hypothetical protein
VPQTFDFDRHLEPPNIDAEYEHAARYFAVIAASVASAAAAAEPAARQPMLN